jgi:DNA-binding helix-hairpin-helix protein with protein kinase domain
VYLTDQPSILAKIYNKEDDPERLAKLSVMIDHPPNDPSWTQLQHRSIAWPLDLLMDEQHRCVGFSMPYIQDSRELTHVYNPAFRMRFAPKFNWYYLHSAALNYVSAVEAIHYKNFVVGDIKPQNILVNSQALISVIDTDSFQITDPATGRHFRCPVGTEGFTPRELLEDLNGKPFRTIDRTERHDRFGIAVIVYLLLFGRHPFMEGRWKEGDPPTPDERVMNGLWIHNPGHGIGIDRVTIPLEVVNPVVEQCFRRCFSEGHWDPQSRPSANEWRKVLKNAVAEMVRCNKERNHWYSGARGRCPWCERKMELGFDIFSPIPIERRDPNTPALPAAAAGNGGGGGEGTPKSRRNSRSRKRAAAGQGTPQVKVTRPGPPQPKGARPLTDAETTPSGLWDAVAKMFKKKP